MMASTENIQRIFSALEVKHGISLDCTLALLLARSNQ
jgi:hypothetical protein